MNYVTSNYSKVVVLGNQNNNKKNLYSCCVAILKVSEVHCPRVIERILKTGPRVMTMRYDHNSKCQVVGWMGMEIIINSLRHYIKWIWPLLLLLLFCLVIEVVNNG